MNVFLLSFGNNLTSSTVELIDAQLKSQFGEDNIYKAGDSDFFIADAEIMQPQAIAEKLGDNISGGTTGNYVITTVSAYWGFHSHALWNWLALKGL